MALVQAPETTASALLSEQSDEAAIAAYEQSGGLIVRGLIGERWLGLLRAIYGPLTDKAYIPFQKGEPDPEVRQLFNRHFMWEDNEDYCKFLFQSDIARAAARAMRANRAQLYEDILITEPAAQKPAMGWHQDDPSWPVTGRQLCSVWFSMEAVDVDTGAMRWVQESHRGPAYHPPYLKGVDAGDDVRTWTGGAFPSDEQIESDETVVVAPLEPGDAVIFHPHAIHTSYGSAGDRPRQSFTIRFMGDDVRWIPRKRVFHSWMLELGLKEGDRIVTPRMPVVWDASMSSVRDA